MARTARPNRPVAATLGHFRKYARFWLGLGIITAIINELVGYGVSKGGGLAQNLWAAIALTAFVWTVRQLEKRNRRIPAIRAVFYDGTAAFIKQLIVILFWLVCLIPFLIGSFLVAQIISPAFAASGPEIFIAFGGWLLLAALSGFWVLRTVFAPILLLDENPWQAIKDSWHSTRRRVRWLAAYMIGAALLTFLPNLLIFYLTEGGVVAGLFENVLDVLAGTLMFMLVLPVMSVLLYQLYVYETRPATRR